MAKDTNSARLRAYALVGARARLEEIRKEEASLRAAFPELFRRGGRAAAAAPARARGRRSMSAAQKKAVSERMKKYWAERRKAEKK